MTADNHIKKTFNFQFIDAPPKVVVELSNASENTLKMRFQRIPVGN